MTALEPHAAAIVAAPLATAPRLAWADAIAASDPFRAEYVRTSIAALSARLHAHGDTPEGDALVVRADRLFRAHRARWEPREPDVGLGFVRGFPEQARCTTDTWRARGLALRARYPLLHLDAQGPARALSGQLAGLRSLSLAGSPQTLADLAALFDDPAARALVWLDLSATGLGLAALDVLAERASALRYLAFDGNPEGTPTAWWTSGDGGLIATGGTAPSGGASGRWGDPEWLATPAFRCAVLLPELYYPYPDL